jgi:hypothetical protein
MENKKVIDVIQKAFEANLVLKEESVKQGLIDLLEKCQNNIGQLSLNCYKPETAESMRMFYQEMIPVLCKLKDDSTEMKNFLELPVEECKSDKIFD